MKLLPFFATALAVTTFSAAAELPALIAHRGASHAAPENTLAAFKLAWDEGADGIEGDFRLTADGEVVCIHDEDTKRVGGNKRPVADTPWAELAKLDVGSWKSPAFKDERIPRLADVLDVLPPDKKFFLEIKGGPEMVGPIREILEAGQAEPARVTLISFNAAVVAACREQLPDHPAHWISDLKEFRKSAARAAYARQLEDCGALGLQFKAASPVDPAWLLELREKGLTLSSWTVDDVATARKMIAAGVHNITTNRPGPLRAELTR